MSTEVCSIFCWIHSNVLWWHYYKIPYNNSYNNCPIINVHSYASFCCYNYNLRNQVWNRSALTSNLSSVFTIGIWVCQKIAKASNDKTDTRRLLSRTSFAMIRSNCINMLYTGWSIWNRGSSRRLCDCMVVYFGAIQPRLVGMIRRLDCNYVLKLVRICRYLSRRLYNLVFFINSRE